MKLASSFLALALFFIMCASSRAEQTASVTLTRTRGHALAIFDATSELTQLIAQKESKAEIMRTLEADALVAAGTKRDWLRKRATDLTVQVVYARTGAISPTYQVATFAGFEKLLRITTRLDKNATKQTAEQVRAGKVPANVKIQVTGALPPEIH